MSFTPGTLCSILVPTYIYIHPSSFQPKALRSLQKRTPNPDYAPISAEGYFAQAVQVSVQASGLDFRVYYTPPVIPDNDSGKGTVMVCHHGAGYSGLSFACFAKEVRDRTGGECGVLAMDARRHGACVLYIFIYLRFSYIHNVPGKTKPINDKISDKDLSVNVLANDAYNLLSVLFPNPAEAPIFLVRSPLFICSYVFKLTHSKAGWSQHGWFSSNSSLSYSIST